MKTHGRVLLPAELEERSRRRKHGALALGIGFVLGLAAHTFGWLLKVLG